MTDDLTATHRQELRRGTVVLACLVRLRTPEYGYALLDRLGVDGFPVDANTLYPLLRRLEKQGLLTSEWDTSEARPRKFYRTSRDGERLAATLLDDWRQVDAAIAALAVGDDPRGGPPEHTDGSTEA